MKALFLTIAILLAGVIPAIAQDPGWIGISIGDQQDGGVIVRRIEPNSPAVRAGLREGDVILEFNREPVIGVQQLTRIVRETPVGRTVDIKVRRDGREETLKITSERASGFYSGRFEFNMPEMPNVRVFADGFARRAPRVQVNTVFVQDGIRVEQMSDQLREYFGVSGNNGVLVTAVDVGSAAEKAGIKAGDVITAIDGRNVRTPAEFSREMRGGSGVVLKVVRDKLERDIKID
jgi:serine protease Do